MICDDCKMQYSGDHACIEKFIKINHHTLAHMRYRHEFISVLEEKGYGIEWVTASHDANFQHSGQSILKYLFGGTIGDWRLKLIGRSNEWEAGKNLDSFRRAVEMCKKVVGDRL